MDINWSKTYFMFVSGNRKVKTPNEVLININVVSVVNEFKLIGVLIDNPKIYSIKKKLVQLLFSVRIQFYIYLTLFRLLSVYNLFYEDAEKKNLLNTVYLAMSIESC